MTVVICVLKKRGQACKGSRGNYWNTSHCICNFIPDLWAIEWVNESQESRAENAEAFGIDSTTLKEVINWVTPRFGEEIGWPNICFNLDIKERFDISPNKYGLIELFDDACKCIEYIARKEVGAEPGLWLPWLLIEVKP